MYNLGLSEALIRDPAALEHLGDALVQTVEPLDRAAAALAYSTALVIADRSQEAVDVLIEASDRLPADSDLSLRIEAQILGAAAQQLTTRPIHAERMKRISERQLGDTGAERVVLVNLVAWAQIAGDWAVLERIDGITDSHRALLQRLLERGYANGRLLAEETSDSQFFQLLAGAMTVNDWPSYNSTWDDAALEDARRRGSILGFALTSCFRAHNFFRRGLISDCDADARAALAAGAGQSWALAPAVCSILIEALIELGELDEAQAVLHSAPDPARDSMTSPVSLALSWPPAPGPRTTWRSLARLPRLRRLARCMGSDPTPATSPGDLVHPPRYFSWAPSTKPVNSRNAKSRSQRTSASHAHWA